MLSILLVIGLVLFIIAGVLNTISSYYLYKSTLTKVKTENIAMKHFVRDLKSIADNFMTKLERYGRNVVNAYKRKR